MTSKLKNSLASPNPKRPREEVDASTKDIWECDNCEHHFSMDAMPRECPNCDYYHCGDMTCCTGEGFMVVDDENVPHGTFAPPEAEDTKPGKLKNSLASPTVRHFDWLLLLPAKSKEDTTLDKAMFLDSEYPPELIVRGIDSYKLHSQDWSDDGKGTARYRAAEPLLGQVYRDWDELKKAASGKVEEQIQIWKEEFGAVIDAGIGDGEGVSSMILDGDGKELRAGGWLNRDIDGCLEYLNWTITGIVSDKVGLRYVSVWRNNYPSESKGAYGWEVRMGGAQLGVSGGIGMEKLVGYSDTLNAAKTDGMKALLEVNRVEELRAEEKKKMKEMISAPMMPKEDEGPCFHGSMFNPNCPVCVERRSSQGE